MLWPPPPTALMCQGGIAKIAIDRSRADTAAFAATSGLLNHFNCPAPIKMVRTRHPDNRVGQSRRSIGKRYRPMPGIKVFAPAPAVLEGIEVANMIGTGQLGSGLCPFGQLAA